MSFDFLAPHYRWMEIVLAGKKLQRCRTAYLEQTRDAKNVLIFGEGNGRFLTEFLHANPRACVTCLDASGPMLDLARRRVGRRGLAVGRVTFEQADVLEWTKTLPEFDLIATHFFLDCFRADQLAIIIAKLAAVATPAARWLLSDFCEPEQPGWKQRRARLILRTMYLFFRVATNLPARRVTSPDAFLRCHGFQLRERRLSELGLLHADLWEKGAVPGGAL